MEKKLEEILEHIYEIKLDLREHIRRTEQNEEMISQIKSELDPIKNHFVGIKWVIGTILTCGSLAGAILAIMKLL